MQGVERPDRELQDAAEGVGAPSARLVSRGSMFVFLARLSSGVVPDQQSAVLFLTALGRPLIPAG